MVEPSNVSLSGTETSITPTNAATGLSIPQSGPGRVGYIAEATLHVPLIASLTAGTVVTVNFRSGTTISATLVHSATVGTGTGQTSCGVDISVPIPAGVQNLFVGVLLSGGTGTATNGATAPSSLTLKYFN